MTSDRFCGYQRVRVEKLYSNFRLASKSNRYADHEEKKRLDYYKLVIIIYGDFSENKQSEVSSDQKSSSSKCIQENFRPSNTQS